MIYPSYLQFFQSYQATFGNLLVIVSYELIVNWWHKLILLSFVQYLMFLFFSTGLWMWTCKECSLELATRYLLLQHFRQAHGHLRGSYRYPCQHTDCPCTFNTWSKLLNHTYKNHPYQQPLNAAEGHGFKCHVCSCKGLNSERFFSNHKCTSQALWNHSMCVSRMHISNKHL